MRNKPIIIGCGRTTFGEHYERDPEELMEEAGLKALDKAGLERKDLDAVMMSNYFLQLTNKIGLEEGYLSEILGLHIPMETSRSFSSAINHACNAIEANRYNIVLVGGIEKMCDRLDKIMDDVMMLMDSWSYYSGGTLESHHKLMLRKYMKTYNVNNSEDKMKLMRALAYISHKNHEYGSKNPHAQFYRLKVDVETVIKTRGNSLLGLYDFAPISDGATAIIIVSEEAARKLNVKKGVQIVGRGCATDYLSYTARENTVGFKTTRIAMEKAIKEAGIGIEKIKLMELYDQSTFMELIALEDLGLCKPGTSWKTALKSLEEKKYTYNFNGFEVYVNTNGGLKADGNPYGATGGAQIYEIYMQMMEEAGDRQIKLSDENYALNMEHEGFGTKTYIQIFRRWIG
ncbi:MAG: thiolase family protein [Candidatus Methanomethylicia archaeon]|nr:thiolase family protein [Candidatus Methanomethylicia archaeon]